jgi:hypothetical protein
MTFFKKKVIKQFNRPASLKKLGMHTMTDHTNFSGVWRADFQRSKLEIDTPKSTMIQIEHNDPEFLLTRTHEGKDTKDTISLHLSTDGKECIHHKGPMEIRSLCVWEGDSLLFTSRIISGQSQAENNVRYRLSADGSEILANETYNGPPKSYHNQWVLVRK